MKVAVVFLTFIACALALPHHHDGTVHDDPEKEERIKKIHEYSKACVEETGTTEEVSRKLINGDFSVRDEPAQCYVKCFFKKSGLMNEEGEPQREAFLEKLKKKKLDTENVEELVDKCVALKGENECETAFRIYECYRGHVTYVHEFKDEEKKTEEKKVEEKKEEEKKDEVKKEEEEKKEEVKKDDEKKEEEKKLEEKTEEKAEEKKEE